MPGKKPLTQQVLVVAGWLLRTGPRELPNWPLSVARAS
jgi:hypothetical protein